MDGSPNGCKWCIHVKSRPRALFAQLRCRCEKTIGRPAARPVSLFVCEDFLPKDLDPLQGFIVLCRHSITPENLLIMEHNHLSHHSCCCCHCWVSSLNHNKWKKNTTNLPQIMYFLFLVRLCFFDYIFLNNNFCFKL